MTIVLRLGAFLSPLVRLVITLLSENWCVWAEQHDRLKESQAVKQFNDGLKAEWRQWMSKAMSVAEWAPRL